MRVFLFILFCGLCSFVYSQDLSDKIKPTEQLRSHPQRPEKLGYIDVLGNWLIEPQFTFAYNFDSNGVALVSKYFQTGGKSEYLWCFIDLNGSVLIKYPLTVSRQLNSRFSIRHVMPNVSEENKNTASVVSVGDKYYEKAIEIVNERKANGIYNNVYEKIVFVDQQADSINTAKMLAQIEKARQDSVLLAEATARRMRDNLIVERIKNDPIEKVNVERRYTEQETNKISLEKITITGDGLLLRKDENHQVYSITQDYYNRYQLTHDMDVGLHAVLDVKKVIYGSDLKLLSDSLFHSIDISKLSINISSRSRVDQQFGGFLFNIKTTIKDINEIYDNKEILNTLLLSIRQVDNYMSSFKKLYAGKAYLVEPLFEDAVQVFILDMEGRGASIEDVKINCDRAKRMF